MIELADTTATACMLGVLQRFPLLLLLLLLPFPHFTAENPCVVVEMVVVVVVCFALC
jgi:hypothetical protein